MAIPSPRVNMATRAKPGLAESTRSPNLTSCNRLRITGFDSAIRGHFQVIDFMARPARCMNAIDIWLSDTGQGAQRTPRYLRSSAAVELSVWGRGGAAAAGAGGGTSS